MFAGFGGFGGFGFGRPFTPQESVPLFNFNYKATVEQSPEVWLIFFTSRYCGVCGQLMQQWDQIAARMKGLAKFGHIDVQYEGDELARSFSVRQVPSIFGVYNRRTVSFPYSTLTFDSVNHFIRNLLPASVLPEISPTQLDDFLVFDPASSLKPKVVFFSQSALVPLVYMIVASLHSNDFSFAFISCSHQSISQVLRKRFPEVNRCPSVIISADPFEQSSASASSLPLNSIDEITSFLRTFAHPPLKHLTFYSYKMYLEPLARRNAVEDLRHSFILLSIIPPNMPSPASLFISAHLRLARQTVKKLSFPSTLPFSLSPSSQSASGFSPSNSLLWFYQQAKLDNSISDFLLDQLTMVGLVTRSPVSSKSKDNSPVYIGHELQKPLLVAIKKDMRSIALFSNLNEIENAAAVSAWVDSLKNGWAKFHRMTEPLISPHPPSESWIDYISGLFSFTQPLTNFIYTFFPDVNSNNLTYWIPISIFWLVVFFLLFGLPAAAESVSKSTSSSNPGPSAASSTSSSSANRSPPASSASYSSSSSSFPSSSSSTTSSSSSAYSSDATRRRIQVPPVILSTQLLPDSEDSTGQSLQPVRQTKGYVLIMCLQSSQNWQASPHLPLLWLRVMDAYKHDNITFRWVDRSRYPMWNTALKALHSTFPSTPIPRESEPTFILYLAKRRSAVPFPHPRNDRPPSTPTDREIQNWLDRAINGEFTDLLCPCPLPWI
eukprot:GILI01019289.1.p1 GENE.GILI01019289.1~~GILI01019289.1.p1  ORF type:complete len:758 (-),score=142.90 GILI01019289.1:184-2340(-)